MINFYSCNWCSGHFLEMNYRLIKSLNPDLEFRWIICDHSPEGLDDIVMQDEYYIFKRDNDVGGKYQYGMGSVAHGRGLTFLQENTIDLEAEYHVVIDPDFYLFFSIDSIIERMEKDNIEIFGVGYPDRFSMFKLIFNYPTAIFSIFDVDDFSSLDFNADIHKHPPMGNNLDPSGLRKDVGYKILLDCMEQKYKTQCVSDNILDKYCDVYTENNSVFGIHYHTFRDQSDNLVDIADLGLMNLPEIFNDFNRDDRQIDFDFAKDDFMNIFISQNNKDLKRLKLNNKVPKSVS